MKKIYNTKGIGIGTFLGGPLAAGYLFFKNYQAFEKVELAKKAILISLLVTVMILGSIIILPIEVQEKIPNYIIPIIFSAISRLLFDRYQKAESEKFISNGGEFYSNWRTVGVSLICMAITFGVAITLIVMID